MPSSYTGVRAAQLNRYVSLGVRLILLSAFTGISMSQSNDGDRKELKILQAQAEEIHRNLVANGDLPPADDDASWVAAGENGYVNCLLTVLAEGTADSVAVFSDRRLPSLQTLARGNASLEAWAKKLTFAYDRLSSQSVVEILAQSFALQSSTSGKLKTILVKTDGSPLAVLFNAERNSDGSEVGISVLRPE